MKKIIKTFILLFAFVGVFTFLFGCDQAATNDNQKKLEAPEDVNLTFVDDNYYLSCSLVENADTYVVYIYNSTKNVTVKHFNINPDEAENGKRIIQSAGLWYVTVKAVDSTKEYADSEESEYVELSIEKPNSGTTPVDNPDENVYSINYVLNGGAFSGEVKYSYTEGTNYILPTPVKSGAAFIGWYLDAYFVNEIKAINENNKEDLNVFAKWEFKNTDNTYTGYYAEASNLKGSQLKASLRKIISRNVSSTTYEQLKTYLQYTDQDPKNSKNVILIFSKGSVKGAWDGGNTWNREHMWPQSLSWFKTSGAGSDVHHIRPVDPTVNSTYHNNRKYGNVPSGTVGKFNNIEVCRYSSNYFEPQDSAKGDTARIIFYLLTRYSESDSYSVTAVAQSMSLLLEWHNLDPVDDFEIRRNERSFEKQGNRNPFIDHPEFANFIWG